MNASIIYAPPPYFTTLNICKTRIFHFQSQHFWSRLGLHSQRLGKYHLSSLPRCIQRWYWVPCHALSKCEEDRLLHFITLQCEYPYLSMFLTKPQPPAFTSLKLTDQPPGFWHASWPRSLNASRFPTYPLRLRQHLHTQVHGFLGVTYTGCARGLYSSRG